MNEGQPSRPANIVNIVDINQGKRALLPGVPEVEGLTPVEVRNLKQEGMILVDTRLPGDFCEAHIPGVLNVQLESAEFEQRVGWLLPGEEPFMLQGNSENEINKAVKSLGYIGLAHRVRGFLNGGLDAWRVMGFNIRSITQLSPDELEAMLPEITVLDVRDDSEWNNGHIQDAVHAPFLNLEANLDELGLDPQAPLAVTCSGGWRSAIACSILARNGFTRLRNLEHGMDGWMAEGKPVVYE